jgi:hypothetical protein
MTAIGDVHAAKRAMQGEQKTAASNERLQDIYFTDRF